MTQEPPLLQEELDALHAFANAAWHDPDAFRASLDRGTSSPVVRYLDLEKHSYAVQLLLGTVRLKTKKIIIRQEYREALQALEGETCYQDGAYIIGQPGIGKTCFPIYILIARLCKHQAVAFQLSNHPFYVLFTEKITFHAIGSHLPPGHTDVWGLSDSNTLVTTPAAGFVGDDNVKVIQATSPNSKRWKGWSKDGAAERYVMKAWSIKEIADLAVLLGLDIDRMTTLATKWGGVPQTLLRLSNDRIREADFEHEVQAAASEAVQNCQTFIPNLRRLDADESRLALIFFIGPEEDSNGCTNHHQAAIYVPTSTLVGVLAVVLREKNLATKITFFTIMENYGVHPSSGSIYENWLQVVGDHK